MKNTAVDWYIRGLLFIGFLVAENTSLIIDLYVFPQSDPFPNGSGILTWNNMLFYMISAVMFYIFTECEANIYVEVVMLFVLMVLCHVASTNKSSYIEEYIQNPELKRECYASVKTIMKYYPIVWVLIWHAKRFLSKAPIVLSAKEAKVIFGVPFLIWFFGQAILTILYI